MVASQLPFSGIYCVECGMAYAAYKVMQDLNGDGDRAEECHEDSNHVWAKIHANGETRIILSPLP